MELMDVIYSDYPAITIAGNTFINVDSIIQYEDEPLLEVKKFEPAGFSTRLTVYHGDGTQLAIVKGKRVFSSKEGENASVKTKHYPDLIVCELEGKPIMELRKNGPSAIKVWAELYAPNGVFVKALDAGVSGMLGDGSSITVGGMTYSGMVFDATGKGGVIGIHVTKDGVGIFGNRK